MPVLKLLAKDSIIYGGADFGSKLVALFTFPLIASVLPQKSIGILELVLTTTGLLGMLIQCGLSNSVHRFYWDEKLKPIDRPTLVSSAFSIQLSLGILFLIIGLFSVLIFPKLSIFPLSTISWIAISAAITLMVFKIWFVYILDVTRLHLAPFRFLSISLASKVTSSVLGCFTVLYLGWGLDGYLSTQAVVMVAIFPLACWLIKKDLTFKISKKWCEETFKYGYPFIFAGIAFWLLGTIDRWMLTAFTSLEEVSVYSVAFRFSSIILFITTAFGMAWGPVAIKIKSENPSKYKKFYADLLGVFLYLILLISGLVGLFSGEIIKSLMSDDYSKSAFALIFLSFGVGLYGTQQITAMGISIEKKTYLFSRIAWISLILNIVFNYFLIQKFGATGASFSTLISYLFITSAYLFYSEKLHKIPFNKSRLLMLLILSSFVIFVSMYFCINDFSLKYTLIKLVTLGLFAILGYLVIKNNILIGIKNFVVN